jgi:hypothetical protein
LAALTQIILIVEMLKFSKEMLFSKKKIMKKIENYFQQQFRNFFIFENGIFKINRLFDR